MSNPALAASPVAALLESNGFAVLEGIISDRRAASLTSAVEESTSRQAMGLRNSREYGVRNLLEVVPAVREIANSPTLLSIVSALIGPAAKPVKGIYFDKTPDANWKVAWHQDLSIAVREQKSAPGFSGWSMKAGAVHVQPPAEILATMLTVRLHLDDAQEENGALRVIPGSHKHGRLDAGAVEQLVAQSPSVMCLVTRGGILLMRPLLLHASSAAASPSHRRVIHLEYSAEHLPYGLQWREA